MTVLYILVPIAIALVIIAIWLFNWAVNNGQYDDLDSPAHSILFDDDDPAHLAAQQREESSESTSQDDGDRPQ
ncbi:MAG: cbb3-type cytochrome oxidase assembly protein CcoS [Pseudomonadaceae bacterium]